jgi:hypothetical protein
VVLQQLLLHTLQIGANNTGFKCFFYSSKYSNLNDTKMIDPKDEVFRDLDDQGRSDDNNRIHDEPGFLGDEEQDTESGNVTVENEEGHETPKAMTIEQEGEKPWDLTSGSTNLTEEQLEKVASPSTNEGEESETFVQPETEGTGYREEPDQLKVGGEE